MDGKVEGRPRSIRWPRVPKGMLGMVALVTIFESFLAHHESDFTDLSATDWRLTAHASTREAKSAELLCFGDSLVKFGLVPDLIERRTGLKTFNLSTLGGQSASSFALFRRSIEAGARPVAIILDCQDLPAVVGENQRGLGLWLHLRNWPEVLDTRDGLELAWSARDPSLFAATALRRILISLKNRHEIRNHYQRFLRDGSTPCRYVEFVQRRNWKMNRGSLLLPPRSSDSVMPTLSGTRSDWMLDPITFEYIHRFFRLAAERKIHLFWLIPPVSPRYESLRLQVGHHDLQTRLAKSLEVEFPGARVIDARESNYPEHVFTDESHLDRVGAACLSNDVAEVVAKALDSGEFHRRWVKLPSFRERPEVKPLEDLDRSRMAVDSQGRTRR